MMAAEEGDALVPKLRFPGFWKSWSFVTISKFFDFTEKAEKTTVFDKNKVLTVKLHAGGVVKNEKATLTGKANYFNRKAGQFIFSKIDLLNGAFGVIPEPLDGYASSSDVPAYSFNDGHSSVFFVNWLEAKYEHLEIERTGTSSTLKRVSPDKFLALVIPAPTLNEQQKIADCLASIDELITLELQKLDTLKRHKKGLMQQLFPAEGETVPRLRFQEFRDAGEWRTKLLGSIGQMINGLSGKSGDDFGQGKPFITYKQVFDSAFVDFAKCGLVEIREGENQNEIKRGDILFTTSSETPDEVGYASVVLREPPCPVYLNSFCFSFRPSSLNELMPEFSGYLFRSPIYRNLVTLLAQGSTRFNISKAAFLNLSLPIPQTEEQQKIADCLTSFDDRIAAQNQKIDALKAHKKGLMQQLFPAPDGFSAAQAGNT